MASSSYCSFSKEASEKCYAACTKAVELSPSNPEANQLMASCLLSQGNEEGAKESLMKGVSLWLPSKVGGASFLEGASVVATSSLSSAPPYFSRMNTAKLLLEVKEYQVSVLSVVSDFPALSRSPLHSECNGKLCFVGDYTSQQPLLH